MKEEELFKLKMETFKLQILLLLEITEVTLSKIILISWNLYYSS